MQISGTKIRREGARVVQWGWGQEVEAGKSRVNNATPAPARPASSLNAICRVNVRRTNGGSLLPPPVLLLVPLGSPSVC